MLAVDHYTQCINIFSDRTVPYTNRALCYLRLNKVIIIYYNKKVLLRERKRHTARRVASAHYAALSNGWGGTPSRPGWGGVPWAPPHHPDLEWGTPHPDLGWSTPHPDLEWGTHLSWGNE